MDLIKKYGKGLLYSLGFIFISTLVVTLFYYFDILNGNIFKWIKVFIPIIALLLGGFIIGKDSKKKGYLEGIKFGLMFVFILFIFTFLAFDVSFKLEFFIYYIIIILSAMLGAMVGINKNKQLEE